MDQNQLIKEKVKNSHNILLDAIYKIFYDNPEEVYGPADITKIAELFRGLNQKTQKQWHFTGQQNDRLAQALINELLNRGKIKRVKSYGQWIGYQYKD